MTEEDSIKAEEATQIFLSKVRFAFREMRASLTEEQFEDYARLKSQDNLSLWSPWMNSLDDSDCWTATRMGPGTFSHDTGPGTKFPACHICGGLKPGTGAENQFIAAAIGHKKTCLYYGK